MRDEVRELVGLGPLPSEKELIQSQSPILERYEHLLSSIEKPVTDEEADALAGLFGVDDSFGLGWTLLHLIETAPNWSAEQYLDNRENWWIGYLKDREKRWREAGYPARSFYQAAGIPDPRTDQSPHLNQKESSEL